MTTCILQCYWLATLLARQYRTDYNRQKTAVILLQANVRIMQVQKILTTQHSAATVIQAMYKCHLQRSWYLRLKSVVIMIQRLKRANDVVRRLKEAKTLREINNAAIVIQRYWRRYHEVSLALMKLNFVKIIVFSYRSVIMKERSINVPPLYRCVCNNTCTSSFHISCYDPN